MAPKELIAFGLDEKEASMYLVLIEHGEANLSTLAKRSGIKRTTTYDVLAHLQKKGLVSLTKRKKRIYYIAEDPRVLERQIEEKKQRLSALLPELHSLMQGLSKKPNIRYYEGITGIEHVYRDGLNYPDQEMVAWVSGEAFGVLSDEFLYDFYLPHRIEKKIWVRALAPDIPKIREYRDADTQWLRQTRLVSAELFPFDVEIDLYGKRSIAILSFKEQFGMIIESEKIWRTLKSIFEMGWIMAEKKVGSEG
jgi:sugar-specific transcriptional regulator TrmB